VKPARDDVYGQDTLAQTRHAWESLRAELDSAMHPVVAVILDAYIARLAPVSDPDELKELAEWFEVFIEHPVGTPDKEAAADAQGNIMTDVYDYSYTEVRDILGEAMKGKHGRRSDWKTIEALEMSLAGKSNEEIARYQDPELFVPDYRIKDEQNREDYLRRSREQAKDRVEKRIAAAKLVYDKYQK